MSRWSFAKTFWILLCHEVRGRKLIHDTDSCFSASHGFTQHFLFLVFETLLFMFCKLQACSDNTNKSADFLFKYLLASSHTLQFTLFASTSLKIFWSSAFKFIFRSSFLQTNKISIYRKSWKILEIVISTD